MKMPEDLLNGYHPCFQLSVHKRKRKRSVRDMDILIWLGQCGRMECKLRVEYPSAV